MTTVAAPAVLRQRGSLLRVLGVAFGLAVAIGNTIGAGILRAPGEIAARVPSPVVYFAIWIAGALYALFGALSLAELGAAIPRSGGQYAFARRALGPYAGFVVGWSDWLSTCGATAAVALLIGEYCSGWLGGVSATKIAAPLVVAFGLLQWRGVKLGARTQELTTFVKTAAFLVLIGACFVLAPGRVSAPHPAASTTTLAAIIFALQSVIYTYDGWTGVIYFSEEVKDPARDIPRALIGSVVFVAIIYLLINLAFVHVAPLSSFAGEPFAAGKIASMIFGVHGDLVIRIVMVISMIAAINALQLIATRTAYILGEDRLFIHAAAHVNPGGTPYNALAASTLVALAFLLTGTFNQVIAVLSFFFVANYALSFISLFVLRVREPGLERPHRTWGYPVTPALALAGSVAFLIGAIVSDLETTKYALIVLALTWPMYRLTSWANSR